MMIKKDIIHSISEKLDFPQANVKKIVQATLDAIVETLVEGGRIELRNFGVFEIKQRQARKAINPRTGESVKVPARRVVVFKPGKSVEKQVAAPGKSKKKTQKRQAAHETTPSRQ